MKDLPAGLADPLHLLEPYPWGRVLTILGLVAFLALVAWWRHRRRAYEPTPSAEPAAPAAPSLSAFESALQSLRDRYQGAAADYRRACHELASTLRAHLEGGGFSTLTAGEIAAREGDGAVARLFGLIARHQFGRRPPTRTDLEAVCDLSLAVARQQPRTERR